MIEVDRIMISPCIQKCKLISGVCNGCGRTREQITMWSKMTEQEREDVIEQLKNSP